MSDEEGGGSTAEALARSNYSERALEEYRAHLKRLEAAVVEVAKRPCVLFGVRPTTHALAGGGWEWVVDFGDVRAKGKTPAEAMEAFDRVMVTK